MSIIEVSHLSKEFKRQIRSNGIGGSIRSLFHREYELKQAVRDISFTINKGEIVGYIGLNGAGKSTSIKMMVGILMPTSGSVHINGMNPQKHRKATAQSIGVVFGQRTQLWWDIPVSESFYLMKYMYKIPDDRFRRNLNKYVDLLELNEFMHVPVRQLSLGQRMRSDLCAALLHNPAILFLDEPTIGLDVLVKEKIRSFIKEINEQEQVTVLLTTHDIADIEKLCSRVLLMDKGNIMYDGSLGRLKNQFGQVSTIEVDMESAYSPNHSLANLQGVLSVTVNGNQLEIVFDSGEINSTVIIETLFRQQRVRDIRIRESSIEDIIRKIYQ